MQRNVGLIVALACAVAVALSVALWVARSDSTVGAVAAGDGPGPGPRAPSAASGGVVAGPVELERPGGTGASGAGAQRDGPKTPIGPRPPGAAEALGREGLRAFEQVPTLVEITDLQQSKALRSAKERDLELEERYGSASKAERAARLEELRAQRARSATAVQKAGTSPGGGGSGVPAKVEPAAGGAGTGSTSSDDVDAEIRWLEEHPGR